MFSPHPWFLFNTIVGLCLCHVGLVLIGSSDVRLNKSHWDAPYNKAHLETQSLCLLFSPCSGLLQFVLQTLWNLRGILKSGGRLNCWVLFVLFTPLHAALIVLSRHHQMDCCIPIQIVEFWLSVPTIPFNFFPKYL